MPQRYVGPEEFSEQKALAQVPLDAAAFYTHLYFHVDDFGRANAEPDLLRAKAFPFRRDLRDTDCSRLLAACVKAGLIAVYEAGGTPYLEVVAFRDARHLRAQHSRFPPPPGGLSPAQLQALARKRGQAQADAGTCPVTVTVPVDVNTPPAPPQAGGSSGSGGGGTGSGGRRKRKLDPGPVGGPRSVRRVDDQAPEWAQDVARRGSERQAVSEAEAQALGRWLQGEDVPDPRRSVA